jgi:hypothetical protein
MHQAQGWVGGHSSDGFSDGDHGVHTTSCTTVATEEAYECITRPKDTSKASSCKIAKLKNGQDRQARNKITIILTQRVLHIVCQAKKHLLLRSSIVPLAARDRPS